MSKWMQNVWEEVARPMFLRPRRVQFAALCTRDGHDGPEVLLVTSLDTGRWIIPKGWPIDGLDGAQTALQEAWEEAGVRAKDTAAPVIGQFSYDKTLKDGSEQPVSVTVHRIDVLDLADVYPEAGRRKREWVSAATASKRVDEPELRDLLLRL